MYCNKCGAKLVEGAAFCSKCGAAQPQVTVVQDVSSEPSKRKIIYLLPILAIIGVAVLCIFLFKRENNEGNNSVQEAQIAAEPTALPTAENDTSLVKPSEIAEIPETEEETPNVAADDSAPDGDSASAEEISDTRFENYLAIGAGVITSYNGTHYFIDDRRILTAVSDDAPEQISGLYTDAEDFIIYKDVLYVLCRDSDTGGNIAVQTENLLTGTCVSHYTFHALDGYYWGSMYFTGDSLIIYCFDTPEPDMETEGYYFEFPLLGDSINSASKYNKFTEAEFDTDRLVSHLDIAGMDSPDSLSDETLSEIKEVTGFEQLPIVVYNDVIVYLGFESHNPRPKHTFEIIDTKNMQSETIEYDYFFGFANGKLWYKDIDGNITFYPICC